MSPENESWSSQHGPKPSTHLAEQRPLEADAGMSKSLEQMNGFIGHFARVASAEACIGQAQTANGHTVLPIASVSLQAGMGMGFGAGGGGEGASQGQGSGGGGGGGGRGASRVIAVVDISESGVMVRPVIDVMSLALGLLALAGLGLLTRRGGGRGIRQRMPALLRGPNP